LLALERFIHCGAYGVVGFRRRDDTFAAGKHDASLKARLPRQCDSFDNTKFLQVAHQRRHSMPTQSARMEYGRYKIRPERVHFHHRVYPSGVKEVVCIAAARERWTSRRLRRYDPHFSLLTEHLAEEGSCKSCAIRASTNATDEPP
jgi:hypothetical protein